MIMGGILSGKVFFSEKISLSKVASVLLTIVGLTLIYSSDIALIKNWYVLIALFSGLIVGFWNTLTKKVSGTYPELQLILIDGLATFGVGLIGLTVAKEAVPSFLVVTAWLWIIAFAGAGILASFFLIKGFKVVEAQVGSLILPMELVFSSIFGIIFFNEILKTTEYFGGFLIFLAAISPVLKNSFKKR